MAARRWSPSSERTRCRPRSASTVNSGSAPRSVRWSARTVTITGATSMAWAARRAHKVASGLGRAEREGLFQLVDDEHRPITGAGDGAGEGGPRIGAGDEHGDGPPGPQQGGHDARPAPATTCRSPTDRPRRGGARRPGGAGRRRSRRRDRRRRRRRPPRTAPDPCRGTRWRWGWRRRLGPGPGPAGGWPPRAPPAPGRARCPSSSASVRRASCSERRASPWRPQRHWASARMAHRCSRNGSSATRTSASATTARCSPAASRASSSSSSAVRRSSCRRTASPRPGAHPSSSANGAPRQSSSARSKLAAACSGSPVAAWVRPRSTNRSNWVVSRSSPTRARR